MKLFKKAFGWLFNPINTLIVLVVAMSISVHVSESDSFRVLMSLLGTIVCAMALSAMAIIKAIKENKDK